MEGSQTSPYVKILLKQRFVLSIICLEYNTFDLRDECVLPTEPSQGPSSVNRGLGGIQSDV